MGNNPSSDVRAPRPFARSMGALGLSKAELDQRCNPSGLYPTCPWEDRAIRRLIADGRLAARQRGSDARSSMSDRECPICFLNYSQINVTACCQANICTECYLQVRPQKEKTSVCPFCNNTKLAIKLAKTMDAASIEERQSDEQKVIEARNRARAPSTDAESSGNSTPSTSFGSSLEKNSTVRLMRARSESFSTDQQPDWDSLSSLALTPEERAALEQEIQAQHTHPLSRQMEQEAEERRLDNERNYYRSQSGRMREIRAAEALRSSLGRSARVARTSNESVLLGGLRRNNRNWNEIVDAFERGGSGEVNSLDDLVVLEAALILSMEEEARLHSQNDNDPDNNQTFDASQHALNGFPLISLSRLSRRSMQLSGISEAEQIEMAIALSLQQSEQQATEANDETNAEAGVENDSVTGQTDEGAAVSGEAGVSAADSSDQREESTNESDWGGSAQVNGSNYEHEEAAGVDIPHDANI